MRKNRFFLMVALTGLFFTSCNNDDDQPVLPGVSISITQDTFGEDSGTITVNFNTTETFDTDVTLTYEVSGTAVAGEDYTALPGTLTLGAGESSVTQNLVLLDDDDVEPSETITITLTAVDGGTDFISSDSSVTLTITDNDSFPFENGILVVHEGNFNQGNASVSFISDDYSRVENGIYKSVNEVDAWGDTAQSMAFDGRFGYIVLNASKRIEVVDRYTFESVATIGGAGADDFLNPRYMTVVNGKGYVTNWGDTFNPDDDFIAVINLENNTVESKISVPEGPERLLAKDNTVYVAHGNFSGNNIVSVIDATTDSVTDTITVGTTPSSLQFDADGKLWVLSSGYSPWGPQDPNPEVAGQLDRIDVSSNDVEATFDFALTEHPRFLSINEGVLYYYLASSIYPLETDATELPSISVITTNIGFYRMSVIDGKLYGVNQSFVENGTLEVYDLSNNSLLLSQEVSIGPGEVYINGEAER
ncbi:YncE family protein [Muricauda sp. SCSIO 64092]|uniref:DUF5074 domain-containing protein n=1 Tax=Allomuricauda sp. SCSIO 64092 TaxID=2908842 RepID=UPI001FF4C5A0|nr:DUF5074 domain-containing protein [Muricauda sp. SCSIO 64092]UOY07005.1 YncE family protein [Muricauda sp. SCSIO 64092]